MKCNECKQRDATENGKCGVCIHLESIKMDRIREKLSMNIIVRLNEKIIQIAEARSNGDFEKVHQLAKEFDEIDQDLSEILFKL